jgi:hypothetical protein
VSYVFAAVAIGIGATFLMDLWNLSLKRVFGIPSLNYCFLGRWLGHMPSATFRHSSIADAPARRFECRLGLVAHYSIGAGLALGLILITQGAWLARPTVLPALLYGIATVAFPFLVMQPAFGLGIASARTARPMQARLKSLATHTVFGFGLYLAGLGLSHLLS